jgi:hypothetical protein
MNHDSMSLFLNSTPSQTPRVLVLSIFLDGYSATATEIFPNICDERIYVAKWLECSYR